MSLNVYLGDLRYHTTGILANDCMPLGVAYMKAVIDRDNSADGEDELAKALIVWTTHIRGLSKLVTRVRTESQVRQCRRTNQSLPMTSNSIAAE